MDHHNANPYAKYSFITGLYRKAKVPRTKEYSFKIIIYCAT
jgi:hypothetical protein